MCIVCGIDNYGLTYASVVRNQMRPIHTHRYSHSHTQTTIRPYAVCVCAGVRTLLQSINQITKRCRLSEYSRSLTRARPPSCPFANSHRTYTSSSQHHHHHHHHSQQQQQHHHHHHHHDRRRGLAKSTRTRTRTHAGTHARTYAPNNHIACTIITKTRTIKRPRISLLNAISLHRIKHRCTIITHSSRTGPTITLSMLRNQTN